MNDQTSENQDTPTPPQIEGVRTAGSKSTPLGWITASAIMWMIGGFVAVALLISAVFAFSGMSPSSISATPTPAIAPVAAAFEPPVPNAEQNFGRVPVPTYLDATRACNATAGQDPKAMDSIMRSRCAAPNTNSDMYVIRILLNAGESGNLDAARKAFTPGTSDRYISSVIHDNYFYQNMRQIFWSGSIFQPYQDNGNIIEFEHFYGAIAYTDGSYRRFTAVFQKMNGQWKMRSMDYESLS